MASDDTASTCIYGSSTITGAASRQGHPRVQCTLDPRKTEWDSRCLDHKRSCFSECYNFLLSTRRTRQSLSRQHVQRSIVKRYEPCGSSTFGRYSWGVAALYSSSRAVSTSFLASFGTLSIRFSHRGYHLNDSGLWIGVVDRSIHKHPARLALAPIPPASERNARRFISHLLTVSVSTLGETRPRVTDRLATRY